MKNSNDTIGNRTRDLPTCSAVPQPTAPPAARNASREPRHNVVSFSLLLLPPSQGAQFFAVPWSPTAALCRILSTRGQASFYSIRRAQVKVGLRLERRYSQR
jgi:hypothetical protein